MLTYSKLLKQNKSYTKRASARRVLPTRKRCACIISKEIWEEAQFLLEQRPKHNVRASSGKRCHRYAGLLRCGDCGSTMVCKTRRRKNIPVTATTTTERKIAHRIKSIVER